MPFITRQQLEEAAAAVRARTQHVPRVGMVLGSGLGKLADAVEDADVIPYEDIPHWPGTGVEGHAGNLVAGKLEGQTVVAMQGRAHFYEGHHIQEVTLPIRVMRLLGAEILIVTNAAGGLNKAFSVTDLMVLTDHISLPGMTGINPLIGPNMDDFGPRFPSMKGAYDAELRAAAVEIAQANDIPIQQGIYTMLTGPTFESPAEIRMLRELGADAVGMSTVPEVTVARHGYDPDPDNPRPALSIRMHVLGISGITNIAVDDPDSEDDADHEEVMDAGRIIVPRLETIVRGVLRRL